MRILYIAHEQSLGGATRSLLGLIDEMNKKGMDIYVLISGNRGDLYYELEKRKVNIIESKFYMWMGRNTLISKYKSQLKVFLNYYFTLKVLPQIKVLDIDIIHTNTSVINIGGYLSKYLKIPHIWHIREFGEEDHGLYFLNKSKSLEFMNKYSNEFIVISKSIYEKFKHYFNGEKLNIIYNGISTEYIQEKSRNIDTNELNVLISGALQMGKGQVEAIEAFEYLKKKGFKNIKLYIAGNGEEEYKEKILSLIEKKNLKDIVIFLGYVKDMNTLRKNIDIELVCSKSEAFGRVTVEAMLSMNPVIGSNTGANTELIQDTFNGLLYEQGNPEDLASKIEYLLKSRNEMIQMGINAFEYAKRNFSAKKNADQIEELYKKVINITN